MRYSGKAVSGAAEGGAEWQIGEWVYGFGGYGERTLSKVKPSYYYIILNLSKWIHAMLVNRM